MARVMPRLLRYLAGMIGGTFIFGLLLLYFVVGGDFAMMSPSTSFGAALSVGIGLAVLTALLNVAVTYPSSSKLASISGGMLKRGEQSPPPEMMRYARRARMGSVVGTVLLLIVLLMMVIADFY